MMAEGETRNPVVADSLTREPLPSASVFDRSGKIIGIANRKGRLPYISPDCYPVTVRYIGFKEKAATAPADTIFLQENISELPEVVVESRAHKLLHILGYVREYSTLTTYTDTVFLFREKMVDYMLNPDKKTKFKGWSKPRVIASRSYYRFTNSNGLDSVSDASQHHFSWSDWMGVPPPIPFPVCLRGIENGSDTIRGKYSPTEIWIKRGDRVTVDVNVLADTASRKWIPSLSGFFQKDLDFEQFRVRFNYGDITGDSVPPQDLCGYSFNIESNGRGHGMFMFNKVNEPFFVSTFAEVYILDKEYITVKEARKWENRVFSIQETGIIEPPEAPPLQPGILELVERVDNLDKDKVRLALPPDQRYVGIAQDGRKFQIGYRALQLLKDLTGITRYKSHKNINRRWSGFRQKQVHKNNRKAPKE